MARIYKVRSESVLTFFIRADSEEEAQEKCGIEFMEHVAGSGDLLVEILGEWDDGDPAIEQDKAWLGVDFDLVEEDEEHD